MEQHERSAHHEDEKKRKTKASSAPSSQYGLQIGYLCLASLGAEEAIDGHTEISCPKGIDSLYGILFLSKRQAWLGIGHNDVTGKRAACH